MIYSSDKSRTFDSDSQLDSNSQPDEIKSTLFATKSKKLTRDIHVSKLAISNTLLEIFDSALKPFPVGFSRG